MFKANNTYELMEFNYPLSSDSIREIEKHTKYDQGLEESHFNEIAANYDAI